MTQPPPAYSGSDKFIFVCYAHADRETVYPEIVRLNEQGFNVWYDDGIQPGSEWSQTIAEAIEGCSVFLYLVSPDAVASEHCRQEVSFALEEKCIMLALHLKPTDVPSALRLSLSHRQAILKASDPRYAQKLERALHDALSDRTPVSEQRALRIGEARLDLNGQRLTVGTDTTALDPKEISVLMHLIETAPDLVDTESLISRSWPGMVVGDNALQQVIARLRKAFGDDAKNPQYIETLPRRGYRLKVAATELPPEDEVGQTNDHEQGQSWPVQYWLAGAVLLLTVAFTGWYYWSGQGATPAMGLQTDLPAEQLKDPEDTDKPALIAVFDLIDLSPSQDMDWLAIGIARDVREQIGSYDEFNAVPAYLLRDRQIAAEAGTVDVAVDGTLQVEGENIEVKLDAVDLVSGQQLWAFSFPAETTDMVRAQKQLGTDIARVVTQSISGRTWGPQKPEAYSAFLKFLYHSQGSRPEETILALEETLRIDPDWADGWAILGFHQLRHAPWYLDRRYIDIARDHLARAQSISGDPEVGSDLDVRIRGYFEGDFALLESTYREWEDRYAYAVLMLNSGLVEEARDAMLAHLADHPHVSLWDELANAEFQLGNYQAAVDASRRCAYQAPPRSYNCVTGQIHGLLRIDLDEARNLLAEIHETQTMRTPGTVTYHLNEEWIEQLKFFIALQSGDSATALDIAERNGLNGDHIDALFFYLHLDDEQVWQALEAAKGVTDMTRISYSYARNRFYPEYTDHPIVLEFERALGYTDEWRLELCEKANLWPAESGVRCDVTKYQSAATHR